MTNILKLSVAGGDEDAASTGEELGSTVSLAACA